MLYYILQLLWHGIKRAQYNYRPLVNTAHHESILSELQIFVRDSSIKTTETRMQSIG